MRSLIPFGPTSFAPADMDRLFGELLGRPLSAPTTSLSRGLRIRIDVHETDESYLVTAEVPGVAKDDLDLTITADALTIAGEKKQVEEAKGHVERTFGRFERTVQLPLAVDPDASTAELDQGLLRLTLPKADTVRPRKLEIGG